MVMMRMMSKSISKSMDNHMSWSPRVGCTVMLVVRRPVGMVVRRCVGMVVRRCVVRVVRVVRCSVVMVVRRSLAMVVRRFLVMVVRRSVVVMLWAVGMRFLMMMMNVNNCRTIRTAFSSTSVWMHLSKIQTVKRKEL